MENTKWLEFRRTLKEEWKNLWKERIDDKFNAEGIANRDYDVLFIDRGTVIFATRDAKIPSFREILEVWVPPNVPYALPPDPRIGGWRKFIRTELAKTVESKRRFDYRERPNKRKKQQLKKGGNGWLHIK